MDLRLSNAEPSADERQAVDSALVSFADGHATPGRHHLLPVLWAVQSRIGWISEGALNHLCSKLDVAPAEAFGVASF